MPGEPLVAARLGNWDCFCVYQPTPVEDPLLAGGQRHIATPQSQPQPSCEAKYTLVVSDKDTDEANESLRSDDGSDYGAWKPLLPLLAEPSNEDTTCGDNPSTPSICWRDLPFQSVPRHRAGQVRLRVRDAWNHEELKLGDVLARGDYTCAHGLDEDDFRTILCCCWEGEIDESDLDWIRRLAARGPAHRDVSLQEVHYATRAWHGMQSLPREALRRIALLDSGAGRCGQELQILLEELNEGLPVPLLERHLIVEEASAVSGEESTRLGRTTLMWTIGAWYANVQRRNTSWPALFRIHCANWAFSQELHAEILFHIARLAPDLERDANGGVHRGSTLLDWSPATHAVTEAFDRGFATPLERVLRITLAVVAAACLLILLVFPMLFFSYLLAVGLRYGGHQCPSDLDDLLTWFGAVGLSALAVDCADGATGVVAGPRSRRPERVAGAASVAAFAATAAMSWVGLCLRAVLFVLPWVGVTWTFRLTLSEQVACGKHLWFVSAFVWPSVLIFEMIGGFYFFWGLAVLVEHELSLRVVLAALRAAPRLSTPTAAAASMHGNLEDALPSGTDTQPLVDALPKVSPASTNTQQQ
eukprot:TRINITY_DN24776_c0_g1_i1.p1 TRINITY_DN24776_c0_g1~~TRINITY_DN24776_c0_g1_i1.p1  ORF type:complete len:615 (-),score=77.46 TRINITY_DN24776_c0_g1_i1:11-1774(-)